MKIYVKDLDVTRYTEASIWRMCDVMKIKLEEHLEKGAERECIGV